MGDAVSWLTGRPELALIPLALAVIAILALIVSRRSASTARRSLGVSERQEIRRRPDLRVDSLSATCEVGTAVRSYIFDLLVRNPSDSANSIVTAELWIDYAVASRPLLLRLEWTPTAVPPQKGLTLPINIDANKAAAGSLHIDIPRKLLTGIAIDRYRLVLTDTFGNTHVMASDFIQERLEIREGDSHA